MNKRSSVPARAVAVAALVGGVLVVVVVVATSLGGGGDSGSDSGRHGQASKERRHSGPAPKSYVVQSGDTLTSIAHRTGVTVASIVRLNPGIDPQILVSGERLKLR